MTDLQKAAKEAITLMDLTSLNDDDTDEVIEKLCRDAKTPAGNTAAVCIYPRFIPTAKRALAAQGTEEILVATVTNFPHGSADIDTAVSETKSAIEAGADEVDVVFPYRALMNGDEETGRKLVEACKDACGEKTLKVILETGELESAELIEKASRICIDAGADFIKTSTGKVPVNATLEAAEVMLRAIQKSGRELGFKAAGGVRDAAAARDYMNLAREIMGDDFVRPERFRFGASSLLGNLLAELGIGQKNENGGY